MTGDMFDGGIGYDVGVTYSSRERDTETPDTVVEKMAFALDGLGGPLYAGWHQRRNIDAGVFPACTTTRSRPRSHGLTSPGSSTRLQPRHSGDARNIRRNLANCRMAGDNVRNELLVWDAVINGETPWDLPGGKISWAAGVQARNEHYDGAERSD
jgi:hypothetical protein